MTKTTRKQLVIKKCCNDVVMMMSWVDLGAVDADGGCLVRLEEVVAASGEGGGGGRGWIGGGRRVTAEGERRRGSHNTVEPLIEDTLKVTL